VRQCMQEKSIECALLDRHVLGTSKYRTLGSGELETLLPKDLSSALT
jgi:proteasome alpha subunit